MSFGVSVSDIITVISLAKDTVQFCRHAPSDFAEASRVSQSLYLMLEGVKTEYQNPDSPLHKDERTRIDFAIHFKNCERSLKPLAELIIKHQRLATSNIRIIDRARFPKKDYLESRGDLAFYTARLSEFLQMVGLSSLGRIEQKIEEMKGDLPILMSKLDQMCAEFRIMGDKESLLSDHIDDEKIVWKTFRSKLNEAGFTSNVLQEHEAAIFLRIRELTKCGLLDTDGSNSHGGVDETLSSPPPVYQMPFRSNSKKVLVESDADSQKIISPKPSITDSRPRKLSDSDRESQLNNSNSNPLGRRSKSHENPVPRASSSSLVRDDAEYDNVPRHTGIEHSSGKLRVWRNVRGDAILKGTLSAKISRSGCGTKMFSRKKSPSDNKDGLGMKELRLMPGKQAEQIIVDIVFVHGLGGSRHGSWTRDGVFWPQELLAQDYPSARILTWGYDADVFQFLQPNSTGNINDHSKKLLNHLSRVRFESYEMNRPLIFVAHSLGGLIVKHALSISNYQGIQKQMDMTLATIKRSTIGVLFAGTPHRGSDLAKWGSTASKLCIFLYDKHSEKIIDSLKRGSQVLEILQDKFKDIMGDFSLYTLLEELEYSSIGLIVEKDSAVLGHRDEKEYFIHGDHSSMIKFSSREDEGYKDICHLIRVILRDRVDAGASSRGV